jgi:hypothetical protein
VEDAIMRRVIVFLSLGSLSLGALARTALASYQPPAGYELVPLVDSSNVPLAPGGVAVSSDGEMVVTNGSTVTLYNTWQNGRTAIGSITDSAWKFDTDPVFLNDSTVLFGENGNSDALWSVNFSTATPTVTQVTVDNSLPTVEGVAILDSQHALVSGQSASAGSLYLKDVDLTKTSGNVTDVVTGVGTDYPGNPALTPGSHLVLLEDVLAGPSEAHVYTPAGASFANDALDDGNGYGAYGIAFDSAGIAYITTGNTITMISGIDTPSPTVGEFGTDDSFDQFLTSISYTGGDFVAGHAGDTGALIVNDGGGGGAFAIIVPEPASMSLIGSAFVLLATRRRGVRR